MTNAEALYKLKNESLKSSDPFALQSVNEIIDRLECIKIDLVNERQFDPENLMKDLFAVDCDLKALWSGRTIVSRKSSVELCFPYLVIDKSIMTIAEQYSFGKQIIVFALNFFYQ